MEAKQEERFRLYEAFKTVPRARLLAGLVFEAIVQRQLQKGVALTLIPMAKDKPKDKRKLVQWKSQSLDSFKSMSTEDSNSAGAITTTRPFSIDLKLLDTIQFPRPRPSEVHSDIYYVPESHNQAAFDSFIVANGVLHIFQFTIAASHPIKVKLMDFFSHESLEEILRDKAWFFIFVIPRGGELVCPESNDDKLKWFWNNAEFFTAEVDLKKKGE
jgi:hypothetical protein